MAGVHDAPDVGGLVDLTLGATPDSGEGYSTTMRIGFSTPGRRALRGRDGRQAGDQHEAA